MDEKTSDLTQAMAPEPAEKPHFTDPGSGDAVDATIPALSKDGIKLHPQPTSDPLDPLNWSGVRKHGILAIVMSL